jgi:hypothetical protein
MTDTPHTHAFVTLHASHPEGISAHHEKVIAEAEHLAAAHLEAHGFEVGLRHTHTHTHRAPSHTRA